ncbi:hypothetical protein BMS3Bbin11_00059 [bacterium BMS3Bbin11]|nr:hypothetical protein BMS3Bbin11_00059 [bacterium BMS3Bbin11]
MVPHLRQAMFRQVLDVLGVRLFRSAVDILVQTLVGVSIIGLGVVHGPGLDLIFIDPYLAVLHPGIETLQPFRRIVGTHPRFVAVVPVVHTANQIPSFDMSVRHQGTAVSATAIEY